MNGINIIKQLKQTKYQRSNDFSYNSLSELIYSCGFIAQEIRNINDISFICHGEEYDASNNPTSLSLNYNAIFTYNVAATQELIQIVENKDISINDLQQKIINLENENTIIKNALNELLSDAGKATIWFINK